MIGLGIFVLVIVGVVSLAVVFRGGETVQIDMHWFTIKTSAGIVFLAGAVALALAAFGLSLLWEGLKRARRRRLETKDLRQRAEANESAAVQASNSASPAEPATRSSTSGEGTTGTTRGPAPSGGASAGGASSAARTERSGPDDHFDTAPRDR